LRGRLPIMSGKAVDGRDCVSVLVLNVSLKCTGNDIEARWCSRGKGRVSFRASCWKALCTALLSSCCPGTL
jgi:hypothetical protein